MKTIIAALDLQKKTSVVVDLAIEMAEKFNAELHIVHVLAPVNTYIATSVADPMAGIDASLLSNEMDAVEMQKNSAAEQLEKIQERIKTVQVVTKILWGTVANEVVQYARSINAGMIIAGARPHTGLFRLLNKETSVKILHEAQIPILLIPIVTN